MPVSPVSRTAAAVNSEPSHSGSELPSVPETAALAHNPVQTTTPSASLGSQADGPALSGSDSNHPQLQHSMHSTGQAEHSMHSMRQADPVLNGAEPQQRVHSMSQQSPAIPMLQLLQDQTGQHPELHPSQPVSIPPSHSGMAPHSHPDVSPPQELPSSSPDPVVGSKVNSLASSDTSNHTVSVSDSPGGVAGASGPNASGPNASGEGPLVQQQPPQQPPQQPQQQLPGEALAGADTTPGDDSEKAPANQSTAARQPPPVAVPRVPLKKGEIAESFRTLVKQVTWPHNLHFPVGAAVKERLYSVCLACF